MRAAALALGAALAMALHVASAAPGAAPPPPTLAFRTTIQIAEAYSTSPGSGPERDGCLAATARLADPIVSDVAFDGINGRHRATLLWSDRA